MVLWTCECRLKTGFFKTELCELRIYDSKIVLTPQMNRAFPEIIITKEHISAISLNNKYDKYLELEIHAQQGIFIGDLSTVTDPKELLAVLNNSFNRKILYFR